VPLLWSAVAVADGVSSAIAGGAVIQGDTVTVGGVIQGGTTVVVDIQGDATVGVAIQGDATVGVCIGSGAQDSGGGASNGLRMGGWIGSLAGIMESVAVGAALWASVSSVTLKRGPTAIAEGWIFSLAGIMESVA